jgi:hypothetical protein
MEKEKDAQAKEEETKKKSPVQVNLFSRTVLYCLFCVLSVLKIGRAYSLLRLTIVYYLEQPHALNHKKGKEC